MAIQAEYVCLRNQFLSASSHFIDDKALQILKERYKKEIRSDRKLNRVGNLHTLINLLERYDILNCYNVEPMCYISQKFINESDLQNKLADYKARIRTVHCPLYNVYKSENSSKDPQEASFAQESNTSQEGQPQYPDQIPVSCSSGERTLQQIVLQHVSERIGHSWRDAARFLGIREHEIDAIENKYPFDLKKQSYVALENYISQCSDNDWTSSLIQVLEKVRRRDLRETLENLIIHKGQ